MYQLTVFVEVSCAATFIPSVTNEWKKLTILGKMSQKMQHATSILNQY